MTSSKHTKVKSTAKRERKKLRYQLDIVPGFSRVRRGRGYSFTDPQGKRITDTKQLERLRTLVIPPAWKDVWISPRKTGHLQATGIDEQGRKQYIYHPDWTSERQRKKLGRMVAFGKALPRIRRQIATDVRHHTLTKEKVIAIALKTTEETLIRVGNEQYLRQYGSHGLTTLRKKHVDISGSKTVFRFKGKKGVPQEITVRSRKLAGLLIGLTALKGNYLFQYYSEDESLSRLRAQDVNAYIQEHGGLVFSSKDYRTWYASFWAFRLFARCSEYTSEQECQANIVSVLDIVSHRLGNTRMVCKQYYVPDSIIHAYKDGTLWQYIKNQPGKRRALTKVETEQRLLSFLEHANARVGS